MAKFKAHLYETEHSGFYDNNDVKHIPYFLPSAWTTFTPEQITTATFNMVPKTWTKFTVTDGDWMTKNTIIPLSSRDLYLADLLDNLNPKIKTFVPGNHTTITTDARGLKYINQYYNAEDFKHEFNCDQGTISIDFIDNETAEIKLINNTFDLSTDDRCQNWNFTNELSCTNLTALNNTATFIDLTAINHNNTHLTSTSGQTERLNKDFSNSVIYSTSFSATNLDTLSLITPGDYKVSNDFSALTATFSGEGDSNKSLCVNGSAINLSASETFNVQSTLNLSYLSATNTIATSVYNTSADINSVVFDKLTGTNICARNIQVDDTITANKMYITGGNWSKVYDKIRCDNATASNLIRTSSFNVSSLNLGGDFNVYSAAEPNKYSLSGILNSISKNRVTTSNALIAIDDSSSIKTIILYNNSHKEGYAVTYNNTQMKNMYKNEYLNNIIYRLGYFNGSYFDIPIYVDSMYNFLRYRYYILPMFNSQNMLKLVRYKFISDTRKNFYFFNAPYCIKKLHDNDSLNSVGDIFIDDPSHGWDWKEDPVPYFKTYLNTTTVYAYSLTNEFSIYGGNFTNDFMWATSFRNLSFNVVTDPDSVFIYFLNGMNY